MTNKVRAASFNGPFVWFDVGINVIEIKGYLSMHVNGLLDVYTVQSKAFLSLYFLPARTQQSGSFSRNQKTTRRTGESILHF